LTAALVEFEFFKRLGTAPDTLAGICQRFGFAQRPCDVLLTLAMANGWVRCQENLYSITDIARDHLVQGAPWDLSPYYASLRERPMVRDFVEVLKSGKPAGWGGYRTGSDWHQAMLDPDFARSFTAAMDCRGALLGPAMVQVVDLKQRTRFLDIGGGSGIYACAFAAVHTDLKANVFEQAPVDQVTRQRVEALGYGSRVGVLTGDMFDRLPGEHDVHLFSNVLHDWDEAEVKVLLARSYAALESGGLLIIHDAFLNESKTGPLPVAEYSTLLMHTTQGRCYGVEEYRAWCREVGFIPGNYQDTRADRGVLTAVKPS
jgi:predicted O-methyltransferase YrrM